MIKNRRSLFLIISDFFAAILLIIFANCWLEIHSKFQNIMVNRQLSFLLNKCDSSNSLEGKYLIKALNGYLFYSENIRNLLLQWNTRKTPNQRAIFRLYDLLSQKKIKLLVVPVPTKADIYVEYLVRNRPSRYVSTYKKFIDTLKSHGLDYVDLYDSLILYKKDIRLFPRTDTHWDEGAIKIAAGMISDRIRNALPDLHPKEWFTTEIETVATYYGDLGEKYSTKGQFQPDTVYLEKVLDASGKEFASSDSSEIIICGDSFVKQFRSFGAGIDAHVAHKLGTRVGSYCWINTEHDPTRVLQCLKHNKGQTKVVVWLVTALSLMY